MTNTLITIALTILAALLLIRGVQPQGAAAASQPAVDAAARNAFPEPVLPSVQAPFDATPITPVESAGAPMYEAN